MKPALAAAALWAMVAPVCHAQFSLPSIKVPVPKFVTKDSEDTSPKTVECPKFESVKAQQQKNVWCWAACAEMVYKYRGKKMTQAEIAERIHGHEKDGAAKVKAASVYEILVALSGAEGKADRQDRFLERYEKEAAKGKNGVSVDVGEYLNGWLEEDAVNTDELIQEIRNKQPVVIGMAKDPRFEGGHAMIVYGVTYKSAQRNMLERAIGGDDGNKVSRAAGIRKYEIITLKIMDPWTGEPAEMEGKRLSEDCDFMMSQRRAIEVMKKQDEAVKAR